MNKAFGVLLHGDEDAGVHQHFADSSFPTQEHIDWILSALMRCSLGLNEDELEQRCNIRRRHILQV